jgi:hypothetical protein
VKGSVGLPPARPRPTLNRMDGATTSTDDHTPSRRGLLTGLAAAAAASLVAADVLHPAPAAAADGDNVKLGVDNEASNVTTITAGGNGALRAVSTADDGSVVGINTANDGYGLRGTGVYIGVDAIGQVIGTLSSSDHGTAVQAETYDGTAVLATVSAPSAWALDAQGPVRFRSSGRTRIAAGQAKVVLTGLALKPTSLVLATLQTRRNGVSVEAAVPDPAAGTATVYLSKATPGPVDLGWFVIG